MHTHPNTTPKRGHSLWPKAGPWAWPCCSAACPCPRPRIRHQPCLRSLDKPCDRRPTRSDGLNADPRPGPGRGSDGFASWSDFGRGFPAGLNVRGASATRVSWSPAPSPPASTPWGHHDPPATGAPAGGPPGRRAPHRLCLPAWRAGSCRPRAPAGVPDLGPAGGQGVAAGLWVSGEEGGPSKEEGPASEDLRTDPWCLQPHPAWAWHRPQPCWALLWPLSWWATTVSLSKALGPLLAPQ